MIGRIGQTGRFGRIGREGRGSALIVALWIVAMLSILVGSFAFDMQIETRITSYYRHRTRAEHLARAGLERARMLMMKADEYRKDKNELDKKASWYPMARLLAQGQAMRGVTDSLGGGTITLSMVPEPALRNINGLLTDDRREDWERILELAGVPEDLWDALIDCFFDWTDKDEVARPLGAESDDTYLQLEPPYRAKNGPLDTLEELLLIKGFSRAILYGGRLEGGAAGDASAIGMRDLVTVFGGYDVNVNAASERVLMTLPGIDEVTAREIISRRSAVNKDDPEEDASFKNAEDFFLAFPELRAYLWGAGGNQQLISTSSFIYRITSIGRSGNVERSITCLALFEGGRLAIHRWSED